MYVGISVTALQKCWVSLLMEDVGLSLSFIVAVYYIISIAAANPKRILIVMRNYILNGR